MSAFADCRNDDVYNFDFLNDRDTDYINGMDFMLEQIVNLFENNLNVYAGRLEVDTEIDVDKFLDKAKMEISEMIKDWAEKERNMMITAMIDDMDDKEYKKYKKQAIELNDDKEYYDTLKYEFTGKKEFRGIE